jgi:hypothetical protein
MHNSYLLLLKWILLIQASVSSYKIAPRFYMTSAAGGLEKGNSYTIKLTTEATEEVGFSLAERRPPGKRNRRLRRKSKGGFLFLIGRRRSGKPGTRPKGGTPSEARRKKPCPSGKPCPLGGLMVFICRHIPANEKDHFSAISVPQVSETNGW